LEDYYLVYPLTHSEHTRYEAGLWNLRAAFYNLIYIYPVVGLGAAVYFVKSWYENQLRMEQLVKEKYEAELMLLKKQVHPHFLFNTLNNIYALSLTQSPRAPEMIHRLSELLSYMLYDSEWPQVALKAEWQVLEHYAQLEKIRLQNRLELVMSASGRLEGQLISPLLLLPFVENAFKHGGQTAAENCWISCYLHVEKNRLTFQIENSLPTGDHLAHQEKSGLGLRNVRQRLTLAYPGKHELQIHSTDTYLVRLTLQLD
jgi:two-component system, LytTR family, sensor kinase